MKHWKASQLVLLVCLSGLAGPALAAGSRQLGTSGATQLEGAAGGGIVPWAVIAGYASREQRGGAGYLTRVEVDDFTLTAGGVAVGFYNRLELSIAQQRLDISSVIPGARLQQDVFGVKLRLFGDVLYTAAPQVSIGAMYKRNDDHTIPGALGALDDSGTDFYVSATKVWLAGLAGYNAFANATIRLTEANQLGLLGFGGDLHNGRSTEFELAAGFFPNRKLAFGVEYRQKPNNLSLAREQDWWDVFIAYFPNRHWSVVAAYVDLGSIAGFEGQRGFYLSLGGAF